MAKSSYSFEGYLLHKIRIVSRFTRPLDSFDVFRVIPVPINIVINIESLENIQEVKMSFYAKFNLVAEWYDDRLTWNDLNDDKFLNIPDQEVINRLWVPVVIFDNTENKFETPLDKKSRLVVQKKGKYTLAPVTETEETAYYKGSENKLEYSRDFFLRFKCRFELQNYPFDTQICTINIKKPSKEDKFLRYIPKHVAYTGPLGMAAFVITHYDMIGKTDRNSADIQVRIFLKRRISKHILSTYLPSLCILIVAQVK